VFERHIFMSEHLNCFHSSLCNPPDLWHRSLVTKSRLTDMTLLIINFPTVPSLSSGECAAYRSFLAYLENNIVTTFTISKNVTQFCNCFLDEVGSSVSATSNNHSVLKLFLFITTFIPVLLLALRFVISS